MSPPSLLYLSQLTPVSGPLWAPPSLLCLSPPVSRPLWARPHCCATSVDTCLRTPVGLPSLLLPPPQLQFPPEEDEEHARRGRSKAPEGPKQHEQEPAAAAGHPDRY